MIPLTFREAAEYEEEQGGGENGGDVADFVNDSSSPSVSEMALSSKSQQQQLERWTSSNSLTGQNK